MRRAFRFGRVRRLYPINCAFFFRVHQVGDVGESGGEGLSLALVRGRGIGVCVCFRLRGIIYNV